MHPENPRGVVAITGAELWGEDSGEKVFRMRIERTGGGETKQRTARF